MAVLAALSPAARVAGALTVLIGLLVLAGWGLEISSLKSVLRGAVEMKANAAVGLVLAGGALFISSGRSPPPLAGSARVLALIVAALGLGTFSQYVFGWRLGIDELLFRDTAKAYNAIPGRMSPYSALAFGAIGIALTGLPRARLRPLVWLMSALVAAVGVASMLGYVWNASELVTDQLLPPVALHTALAFALLGIGTLLACREPNAPSGAAVPTRASIEFQVAGGFVGAFVLLVVGGGITYRSSVEFVRSAQWVTHTLEVRGQLSQLYSTVSDAESAALLYPLTGLQLHKQDYLRLVGESREYARALSALIADNPSQQQLLQRLNALVTQRLENLDHAMAVYDDHGYEAARA